MSAELKDQSNLNYIVVGGPDKMSMSSFMIYLRRVLGIKYAVGSLHSFGSKESIETYVNSFQQLNTKGVISFYARRKINVSDPLQYIPDCIKQIADIIFWLELYDSKPRILKYSDKNTTDSLIEGWVKILG
jgi:hypothetical protein